MQTARLYMEWEKIPRIGSGDFLRFYRGESDLQKLRREGVLVKIGLTQGAPCVIILTCIDMQICEGGRLMLTELEHAAKVVGAKQVRRALSEGRAKGVYLASDADPSLTQPFAEQAQALGIPVFWAETMAALGRACRIAVGAAVAAVL